MTSCISWIRWQLYFFLHRPWHGPGKAKSSHMANRLRQLNTWWMLAEGKSNQEWVQYFCHENSWPGFLYIWIKATQVQKGNLTNPCVCKSDACTHIEWLTLCEAPATWHISSISFAVRPSEAWHDFPGKSASHKACIEIDTCTGRCRRCLTNEDSALAKLFCTDAPTAGSSEDNALNVGSVEVLGGRGRSYIVSSVAPPAQERRFPDRGRVHRISRFSQRTRAPRVSAKRVSCAEQYKPWGFIHFNHSLDNIRSLR